MEKAFLFHRKVEKVSSPSKTLMANGADNNSSFNFQALKKWSLFRAQQGG